MHMTVTDQSVPHHHGSVWHTRYEEAALTYQEVGPFSPELFDALAEGFRQWAAIVPQIEVDRNGRHKYVNSWGLGAELHSLDMVRLQLVLDGETMLAKELKFLTGNLYDTAIELDLVYPKTMVEKEKAERRLTLTARNQAEVLANFLVCLKEHMFRARDVRCSTPPVQTATGERPGCAACGKDNSNPGRPLRKRANRTANIEAIKRELIEHIKSARDHAHTLAQTGRQPELLPLPSKAELGRRVKLARHTVFNCFRDKQARELEVLYRIAGNLDEVMRFGRR